MENFVEKLQVKYPKIAYGDKPYFHSDVYLFQKFAWRVVPRSYGFSLGEKVPFLWAKIIDEFLDEVEKHDPNYRIQQIKLKYSSLRMYLELNIDDSDLKAQIQKEINKLEQWLQHESLLY
jgi:hypothetical protein